MIAALGAPVTTAGLLGVSDDDGVVVAEGTPHEVLTTDMLREVIELAAQVVTDPVSGTPMVIPTGRRHRGGPPQAVDIPCSA